MSHRRLFFSSLAILMVTTVLSSVLTTVASASLPLLHEKKVKPGVLVLIFNPIIESQGGRRLIDLQGWNNPGALTEQYMQRLHNVSFGFVDYRTVATIEADSYPAKSNGHIFTDEEYLQCLVNSGGPNCALIIDYGQLLADYSICDLVNRRRISELFLWGGPWFGFWEAVQAGPNPIFTNGPPIIGTSCERTLDIMGFNYERGLPEMLEDFAHRVEGNMAYQYGPRLPNEDTPWNKFTLLDREVPGRGGCGTAHLAVNAAPGADYDRENTRTVLSDCDDFLNYPNLSNTFRDVNCFAWGCTAESYLTWWLQHLPHADGQTGGKLNNWWKYVLHD